MALMPPPGADIVPIVPLTVQVAADDGNHSPGKAIATVFNGDTMMYLVVPMAVSVGPPYWVDQGAITSSVVATIKTSS